MSLSLTRTGLSPERTPDWGEESERSYARLHNGVPFVPKELAKEIISASGTAAGTVPGKLDQAPTFSAGGVKILPAIIRNPINVARTNERATIHITLPDGVAPTAAHFVVRDQNQQIVKFQWKPCRHSRTEADIGAHASTAVKAGSIRVIIPYLAPRGEVTYTVEVWPTDRAQVLTPVVTTSEPDGTTTRTECAGYRADCTSAWSRNLSSLVKKSSGFDFFAAADAGIDHAYKPTNAGVAEYSGLSAGAKSQALTINTERDSAAVGYGVVERWRVVRSVGVTEANVQHEAQYTFRADNVIEVLAVHKSLAAIGTTDLKLLFSAVKPSAAGIVNIAGSNQHIYMECDYGSGNRLLVMYRSIKNSGDADGTSGGHGTFPGGTGYYTASPPRLRAGTQHSNYAMPSGSECREYIMIKILDDTETFAEARLKLWNPLVTTAAKFSDMNIQLARFGAQARKFLQRYSAYSATDSEPWKQDLVAAAWSSYSMVGGGDQWALVRTRLQEWLDHSSRGPADDGLGLRLFTNYKAGDGASGWEYVGRTASAIYALHLEARKRGDIDVESTTTAILRGLADHAVLSEADNGGTGRIVLNYTDSPAVENPNATAEAALSIAFARAAGYESAATSAAFSRIWSALNAGMEFANWSPYTFLSPSGFISSAIGPQVLSYYHRVTFALHVCGKLMGVPTEVDVAHSLMATTNAQGQTDEAKDGSNFQRRGNGPTYMHFAANLALYGNFCEVEQAVQIMSHVNEQTAPLDPSAQPMDGWLNNSTRSVGDALCAMLMAYSINHIR